MMKAAGGVTRRDRRLARAAGVPRGDGCRPRERARQARQDPARGPVIAAFTLALCAVSPSALASPADAELRGTALEAGSRRPLTGAVATLHATRDGDLHYLTSSDTDGRFVFRGLSAGAYALEVTLAGYRPGRKSDLQLRPPFRSIVEVILEPGAPAPGGPAAETPAGATAAEAPPAPGPQAAVTITIRDRDQRPVPEGLVSLVPADGEGERRYARTDADGRVAFEGLPARAYRLTASAPGYLTVRSDRLAIGGAAPVRVAVILTPYPLDFAGSLDDLLPPEEPLLERRIRIEGSEAEPPQSGRTP